MGNAVRIQMGVAITAYCLVAIVRNELTLECSTYDFVKILSILLTDKTPMGDLFVERENGMPETPTSPFVPDLLD